MERRSVSTGTIWEQRYSYCRAVRYGDRILVAGTTAAGPSGELMGQGDPTKQAQYIIDKIEQAIGELGGRLADVVRTRIYVTDMANWEAVATVHGERFHGIQPVNTLVEAKLVGEDYLVEIEAEAIIGAGHAL
ncbi:MAG: RidA family protein [Anaerolineaceae bacterium]|nr:MAG: RidA family protein [Anaerolineaceae bacterium]